VPFDEELVSRGCTERYDSGDSCILGLGKGSLAITLDPSSICAKVGSTRSDSKGIVRGRS
jgi:hypothetical protein